MVKAGIFLNILCSILIVGITFTILPNVVNVEPDILPEWAEWINVNSSTWWNMKQIMNPGSHSKIVEYIYSQIEYSQNKRTSPPANNTNKHKNDFCFFFLLFPAVWRFCCCVCLFFLLTHTHWSFPVSKINYHTCVGEKSCCIIVWNASYTPPQTFHYIDSSFFLPQNNRNLA